MNIELSTKRWRFICDPPTAGAANMARDEALLRELEADRAPRSILRLYAWDAPAVSLGKHQSAARAVDEEACRRLGIAIVKRPTGGRAVLHDRELTYAVLSNDPDAFPMGSLLDTYLSVALALRAGLRRLGIKTELARPIRPPDKTSPGSNRPRAPCFAAPSRHELLFRGRKVAGSAQRRLRRAFLQHGSIPLQVDYATMALALGVSAQSLRSALVSVREAAARPVAFEELRDALLEGFRATFIRE